MPREAKTFFSKFKKPVFLQKRIPVYFIEGFLESGKTTWINQWIPHFAEWAGYPEGTSPRLFYVSCEQGFVDFSPEAAAAVSGWCELSDLSQLSESRWLSWAEQEEPDAILVEVNGMWSLDDVLKTLPRGRFTVARTLWIQRADTLSRDFVAQGSQVPAWNERADRVLLTGAGADDSTVQQTNQRLLRAARGCSRRTNLAWWNAQGGEEKLPAKYWCERLSDKAPSPFLFVALLACTAWILYLLRGLLGIPDLAAQVYPIKQGLQFFLSLLFQILPFLLFAALVSSFIQLWVGDQLLDKWLGKRVWRAAPFALLAGFVLPVCDCGLVPIVTRLVRKGTPWSVAALFYVSATVANPLVIASTFFAFPNQPQIYLWRLGIAWGVGLILAILLSFLPKRIRSQGEQSVQELVCASGYLGVFRGSRIRQQIQAVLRHAAAEFLTLSRYVIVGAALSALVHTLLPPARWAAWVNQPLKILPLLLLALFFLSVCASSNAFLARSFATLLPVPGILLYLVFSPLLDVKNLFMLRSGFGLRVARAYVVTLLILFTLLYGLGSLIPAGILPSMGLLP